MPRSGTYQIHIGEKEKQETLSILHDLGITPAEAVKLFFAQIRATRAIPFPIEYTPNEKTAKMLLEDNAYSKEFDNIEDLFADLES
ncbi:MAG: type II toxin-antitoxin system RelB/DinJ family antitoxin [Methylococcaceae bacterium]|nr:type II toxin-antitoxin system RelB/DinJ family antitoxin [Methylococcaceae bacterium]